MNDLVEGAGQPAVLSRREESAVREMRASCEAVGMVFQKPTPFDEYLRQHYLWSANAGIHDRKVLSELVESSLHKQQYG